VLALNDFSFEFAGRYLYKNASWHIKPGEKIGLVGKNGTGKSTLLRLISGEYDLREGIMNKTGGMNIGFLNQDLLSYESDEPIIDVARQGLGRLVLLEKEINELLIQIETDHSDRTLNSLAEKQEEFGNLGGYELDNAAEKILEGLGFQTWQLRLPLKQFSGGWRMRVMLAKLLLQQPDLLLLDEPTNHLDMPSIEWLEEYLSDYPGTFVIVSHDRFFMDRVVTRIVEITNRQLYHYTGNYFEYLEQKQERDEMQQRRFENQQQYIKEQKKFIDRFRYKASKASAVQSRVKQLEKLERVDQVMEDGVVLKLDFKCKRTPGKVLMELKNIRKSYGQNRIFNGGEAQMLRGDKIAFIGANGIGKSTLLRIINGTEPHEGTVEEGYQVDMAFYAQHQLESLNLNRNLLDELGHAAPLLTEREVRTVLGCFLFTGESVFKKIKVLSGGEKARVALAKTLVQESNLLLLDEPTNHLDMQSSGLLAEALRNYKGSFVLVSHDRYFISEVANKIWYIEDGILKEYPGTYPEFNEWFAKKQEMQAAQTPAPVQIKQETKAAKTNDSEELARKNRAKKAEKELEQLSAQLDGLKKEKAETETLLADPSHAGDLNKIAALGEVYNTLQQRIDRMQADYDRMFEAWMEDAENPS